MESKINTAGVFSAGLVTGALGILIAGAAALYMLNMSELVAISVLKLPSVQGLLSWTYANLKLSIIPFSVTLLLYAGSLLRLKRYLKKQNTPLEKIAQSEQLVDIWINLFFGIGVIWTAIGMRGALLEGIGELDAQSAAQLGAFSILQRLVEGGILLALSTTIFGAVGGYLLRLVKSFAVGTRLKAYYNHLAAQQADSVYKALQSIDAHVTELVLIQKNYNDLAIAEAEGKPICPARSLKEMPAPYLEKKQKY